ncbi:MAG: gamma-glutamyltransferase [Marinisporobacter sp.]|jgi:gamma-glutamyltranspeptidase/glutathione hydrolase|nr:gamma-glutamyltransferase [Marinisporobacter sp.]
MDKLKNRRSIGEKAMVSSGKEQASQIGIDILKRGGNAIDAAVAVGFALGVCEPATSGLGGGGFMTIVTPSFDEPIFIDFREVAPKNACPDMWQIGNDGKVVNKENAIGAKSVSIPGEVAGMIYALETYGTMALPQVMAPSIKLAEEGIVVTKMMEEMLKQYAKYLMKCENASRIFLRNKQYYKEGEIFRNLDLANSLREISVGGREKFYKGEIADSMIKTIRKHGGIMTHNDLEEYKVELKEPVIGEYRGYKIISSPPPSSGGTHIIQTLNILENFNVSKLEVNSSEYLHLFSEVFKLSYADRAKYMGDTNFVDVPLKGLSSKKYANILAKRIDPNISQNPNIYDPWTYEHDDTTHYSIGDKQGNLVSVTKTINHFFGSCLVAEGTGILLNDTMADFSIKKNHVNSVDSRKKSLSTMAPTIILKDDKPFVVVGSPGGARIINIVVQVISKIIDHHMDIQDAINSPRITQNTTNKLFYEDRMSSVVIDQLAHMGHDMIKVLPWDKKMGGIHGIKFMEDGTMIGGADPRRDGKAIGL